MALRIIPYIGIGVHATGVVLFGIGPHKTTTDRVVVTEAIVEQSCLAIEPLSGVAI